MLVVAVAIVNVVNVVIMLDGLVTIALVVFAFVVGVDRLLGVPLPVVKMVHMAVMLPGGMAVARQVLVVRRGVTSVVWWLTRDVAHVLPHSCGRQVTP